jgi:trimeric autotransporter adhesin
MKTHRVLSAILIPLLFLGTGPLTQADASGILDALDANVVGGNSPTNGRVQAIAVQPDGKIIIGGYFISVQGVPRNHLARLNADGSLDTTFDPKPDKSVSEIVLQPDGKILLGGEFTSLQPKGAASATERQYAARLNADGSLDTGFDPKPNALVFCIAVQSDGKVVIGGKFTSLQPNGASVPTPRHYIARVNADGSLDTGFDPQADNAVLNLLEQADGKLLLAGWFTTLQSGGAPSPTTRARVARLNADGSLDQGFNPNIIGGESTALSLALQADGKILIGGNYTMLQPNGAAVPTPRQHLSRVNADGSLDMSFDPKADKFVKSVAVQADGKILLGGGFTALQPNGAASATKRHYIARINPDGSLDTEFDPKADAQIANIVIEADGGILIGGGFTTLQPSGATSMTKRGKFARLKD